MRKNLRGVVVVVAAAGFLLFALTSVAATTGSWQLLVAAIAAALCAAVVGGATAWRALARVSAQRDDASTRLRNAERRVAVLTDDLLRSASTVGQLESRASALEADQETLGRGLRTVQGEAERRADDVRAETSARFGAERADIAVQLAAVRRDVGSQVEQLERGLEVVGQRVPEGSLESVRSSLAALHAESLDAVRIAFENAIHLGRDPRAVISEGTARELFGLYLERELLLELRPLLESFDVLDGQTLTTVRHLYKFYRRAGYWGLAARLVARVAELSGRDSDQAVVERITHEIAAYAAAGEVVEIAGEASAHDPSGPILHMVGRVLPDTQTGYTLRTHYTVAAQKRAGLPVAIVGQPGITDRVDRSAQHYVHQGIDYHLLAGPPRNEMLLDDWVRHTVEELGRLVETLRPSILHAQSDFFNAILVHAVGTRYGIPTVYEARGFWEESWLSRTTASLGWGSTADALFETYGLPDAYRLRREAEAAVRLLPDHVFTLAEVMREHIVSESGGELSRGSVSIVPNAVEASHFPVQDPDVSLARSLGIPAGAVTVGYISSLVEYEGIDTLVEGFALAAAKTDQEMYLLIVGDGDYRATLEALVASREVQNVIFTGRVPHEDVLRYYGIIDVFVVPRRPSAVTNLVTPLKPFEAFSTARAVILSDVGALEEIATQSGAVETFSAGSARDLARAIGLLVADPGYRHELGARAARWVRHHRSWDANVSEYYRVYRQLGFAGAQSPRLLADLALVERGLSGSELVESLADSPVPPVAGWFPPDESGQSSLEILTSGWRSARFGTVDLSGEIDWSSSSAVHRSWGFHLHSWEFVDPFLVDFDATGDARVLTEALRIAVDWVSTYRDPEDDTDDAMAWYDMSVALRTPRLLGLTLRAARTAEMRADAVVLVSALLTHLEELHRDRAYNTKNNHGFYTAAAQAHVAKHAPTLPGADEAGREGRRRLVEMADLQFAPDGTHLEHSPAYHQMLLGAFEQALADGLIADDDVALRVRRAAHVLGWMVQPDRTLVQLGDTERKPLEAPQLESIDPQTQFVLTDGATGEPPAAELAVFQDGGYAFVRSPRPTQPGAMRDSGYLAFTAAFHSRAHKHADDLSVVWFDRGQQILTDGGRFGYGDLLPADSPLREEGFYYGLPERQYVEGTMAHNTLMMDGRDQGRRNRQPYGGGLGDCIEREGVFDLSGRVTHADYIHRRRVLYRPGKELLLKDSVFSHRDEEREGIVWFNIDGSFLLEESDTDLVFSLPGRGLSLRVVSDGTVVEPVRGQESPLRGWTSRRDGTLDPVWSLGFRFPVLERGRLETRLIIEERP